jgi:hypothetical protein
MHRSDTIAILRQQSAPETSFEGRTDRVERRLVIRRVLKQTLEVKDPGRRIQSWNRVGDLHHPLPDCLILHNTAGDRRRGPHHNATRTEIPRTPFDGHTLDRRQSRGRKFKNVGKGNRAVSKKLYGLYVQAIIKLLRDSARRCELEELITYAPTQ